MAAAHHPTFLARETFFNIDWASTPLGPAETWPAALQHTVALLLDSAQPMFVVWGTEKTLLFNDAFCPILGARYLEALGQSLPVLWQDVWEDIKTFVDDAFSGHGSLVENKPLRTWASRYQETRYFTFSYTPIRDGKGVAGALCIANDTTASVTATKRIREERDRLRSLFDEAPTFLAMGTTPHMRFTYANRAYKELVNREKLVGKTVAELLPEAEAQGFLGLLQRVEATGKSFLAREAPYVRSTEEGTEIRYIDFIYQPVFNRSGKVRGILCAGYDVTEQRQSREEADLLKRRLEQTARLGAMANMAATLAHELNQPLAAAANYLTGGMRAAKAAPGAEMVKTAMSEASLQIHRAGEIIKRARAAVSEQGPVRESVNFISIVETAVSSSRAAGNLDPRIKVIVEVDPEAAVLADPVQIEQVLNNLLRNASSALAGAGTLCVTSEDRGDEIMLLVKDSGPGLPDSTLQALFTPFVHSGSGMGVGLSICRTIIEAHGGRIAAENAVEGGAVFCFTLPKAQPLR